MVICEFWTKCQRRKSHIAGKMRREDLEPNEDLITDIPPHRVVYCQECKTVHLLWEKFLVKEGVTKTFFPTITRLKQVA